MIMMMMMMIVVFVAVAKRSWSGLPTAWDLCFTARRHWSTVSHCYLCWCCQAAGSPRWAPDCQYVAFLLLSLLNGL